MSSIGYTSVHYESIMNLSFTQLKGDTESVAIKHTQKGCILAWYVILVLQVFQEFLIRQQNKSVLTLDMSSLHKRSGYKVFLDSALY